jgi:hypothetical protein
MKSRKNKAQNSSTSLSNDSTIQTQDSRDEDSRIDTQLIHNTSVFTWKDLTYSVKTPAGERVLLDNVQGWVKPGMLGALMGASGASQPQFWTSNRWLSRPMRAFDALLLSALMTLAVGAPPLVFAIFQNSDPPGNLGAMQRDLRESLIPAFSTETWIQGLYALYYNSSLEKTK